MVIAMQVGGYESTLEIVLLAVIGHTLGAVYWVMATPAGAEKAPDWHVMVVVEEPLATHAENVPAGTVDWELGTAVLQGKRGVKRGRKPGVRMYGARN